MLDEVPLPRTALLGVSHQLADRVELLVAGEDQRVLARLLSIVVQDVHAVDEMADKVQDAPARPDALPEEGCAVARLGGRIACAAQVAPVERQEAGLLAFEPRRHEYPVRIDGEVGQTATELKQRLPLGVPVLLVLGDGVNNFLVG